MTTNTIAAISTPIGPGGIGIIRISGLSALGILHRIFVRGKKNRLGADATQVDDDFQSHRVYYGYIHEVESGDLIDEVLAIYMKGPVSFTREDVVEIHSHSGYVILERVLNAVLEAGADLAEPGEFTRRAFLNGRIDLTQAEAVIDLINAPCDTAARMASRQLAGDLKDVLRRLVDVVKQMQAKCEASIEFEESDDGVADGMLSDINWELRESLLPKINELIRRQKNTAIFHDGALLAITGVPNVGKSSLLNQLVEKQSAIVSEIPGTTRDVIREYLSIEGIPVILCDTAGLHNSPDPIECMGIRKAKDHIDCADLLLLVVEGTRKLNTFEEALLDESKGRRSIVVINKDDLADFKAVSGIQSKLEGFCHVRVSAKTGSGIETLKKMIFGKLVGDQNQPPIDAVTPNLRQRKILEKAAQEIQMRAEGMSVEAMSDMLGRVLRLLGEITGNQSDGDLYDYIFSQFCIGK